MTAAAPLSEHEQAHEAAEARRGFLLALPAYAYLIVFFAIPLAIVFVYSFATRSRTGGTELADWNLDSYGRLGEEIVTRVVLRSFGLALITTIVCLLLAYPFAYFVSTRRPAVRGIMLVGVMIPFWTNFLVRNYAWRVLLSNEGPVSQVTEFLGLGSTEILFTQTAVVIGLVYSFLPFMILPLYASMERIDPRLVEASRDLYASSWASFRRIVLPLSRPGAIAGSILVFVPSFGAYVTPAILGGDKKPLLGSYIVSQFLTARNWPFGATLSAVLIVVMLSSTLVYFRAGGRNL